MTKSSSTATSSSGRAYTFLQKKIARSKRNGTVRLPPIASLAGEGGFSATTISKAVVRLAEEGIITRAPRKGIMISSSPTGQKKTVLIPPNRSEEIVMALTKDIALHWFSAGTILPPRKELCIRYGTCYPTLSVALEKLVQQGKLVPYKKSFRVFQPSHPHPYSSVVFISPSGNGSPQFYTGTHGSEFWRGLEHFCLQRNIHLHLFGANHLLEINESPFSLLPSLSKVPFLGYIFNVTGLEEEQIDIVVSRLLAHDKQIALLVENPKTRIPSWIITKKLCKVFSIGFSELHGRAIGNFLLRQGHRAIAYFGNHRSDRAGLNRYMGIKKAFDEMEAEAHLFRNERTNSFNDIVESLQQDLDRWFCAYKEKTIPDIPFHSSFTTQPVADHFKNLFSVSNTLYTMDILFARALKNKTITAWVTYNDTIALEALRFLHIKKVKVPSQIALVGFDNTLDAFGHGLTTYSFNLYALANAILNHITNDPVIFEPGENGIIELPGNIIERDTT